MHKHMLQPQATAAQVELSKTGMIAGIKRPDLFQMEEVARAG